jgi:hypothetical protein
LMSRREVLDAGQLWQPSQAFLGHPVPFRYPLFNSTTRPPSSATQTSALILA